MKNSRKKKGLWVLVILLILGSVFCAATGIRRYFEEQWAGNNYKSLREQVVKEENPEDALQAQDSDEQEAVNEAVDIPIDFEKLQQENPDVYAWIRIPGTQVDYPILQCPQDDSYYLTHSIERKESLEGAIYTESFNSKDFTDPNTVIYGHNMKNDSMFGSLHQYEDRDFFDQHRDVTIYLPNEILHYQIFGAYVYDNRHLLESFDFEDPTEYQGYLDSIIQLKSLSNNLDTSLGVDSRDSIITLSTCNGNDDERYLVQAVLISIES